MSDEHARALDGATAMEPAAIAAHDGRVLVVEDEVLIGMMIETSLLDAGYQPVVANTLVEAMAAIADQLPDVAILDMHIDGGAIDPVVERLDRDGIPFVFATGGDAAALGRHPGRPWLIKPFGAAELIAAIAKLLAQDRSQDGVGKSFDRRKSGLNSFD